MALLRGKLLAGALFAGALFGPAADQASAVVWDTDQGVARNLAKNLANQQVQGCRVYTTTDPVPAGSYYRASVLATAQANSVSYGVLSGATPLCSGATTATAYAVGWGVDVGTGGACDVSAFSQVEFVGYGCKVGGGRIRTKASAQVSPAGAFAVGGAYVESRARGVKNPTDEELMAMAMTLIDTRS